MRDPLEHPPARVMRLAKFVMAEIQSTPELDSVVQILRHTLTAKKAAEIAAAAEKRADDLRRKYDSNA